ncbi:UNVERIFIED_CONTAM: hypothetical protein PYX00_011868 [Menopon gallinae]|uniref:Transcription initiation factor TFIID 150 kDa subunit n=1 Tax=Menopon gallinae TaxID=328185 RepID=A0AAW2H8Y3_9NEOP
MSKYTILHQRNVYFIDVEKQLYRGYIETSFEFNEKSGSVEYLAGGLEIESVEVFDGDRYTDTEYTRESLILDSLKEEYHPDFYARALRSQTLVVLLREQRMNAKVRIVYKAGKENIGVYFLRQGLHSECVGQNHNYKSHFIFPNAIFDSGYSFDLFYIVPPSYAVISPGKFVGSVEQGDMIIHSYSVQYALPGNINFVVGSFDSIEIMSGDDGKVLYFPMKRNKDEVFFKENASEVVQDTLGCMKFVEALMDIEYPPISIVLTLSPCCLLIGHNTSIVHVSFLPQKSSIQQNFVFREIISKVLVSQLFLNLKDPGYIKVGISGLKKEKDFVVKSDVKELALDSTRRSELSMTQSFFRLKAKLFIHLLENNLSEAFMQKILLDLKDRRHIKTDGFVKLIKNITGKDMSSLFKVYVSRPGTVIFSCTFQIDQKRNRVTFNIKQKPTSAMENSNKKLFGNLCVRAFEIEGIFEHSYNLSKNELVFYYHTRTKKTKKKESEPLMPLLWLRVDPKNEYLAGVELRQSDFMFMEALIHEKSVVGQYEALKALERRPSEQTCSILERVLNDVHVFYKIRIEAAFVLSQVFLEHYDGYQKLIQIFVKKYCLQGSTIIRPNDFSNISSYFMKIGLIKAIAMAFPLRCRVVNDKEVMVRDVCTAFINNVLLYNDNDSNQYEDAFYIGDTIECLSLPLCSQSIRRGGSGHGGMEDPPKRARLSGFEDKIWCLDAEKHGAEEKCEVVVSEKFRKTLNISVEIIEKYRKFDLVSPSVFNKITTSCLKTLGNLYCYGYIDMHSGILIQYSLPDNFIGVRLVAFELLLLKREHDAMMYIFEVLRYDHYIVRMYVITAIKNLLSSSAMEFDRFFEAFKDDFYNLLTFFNAEVVLFEHLVDVILFVENKGKEMMEMVEVSMHELSDEAVETMHRPLLDDRGESSSTVIVLKTKHFAGVPAAHEEQSEASKVQTEDASSIVKLKVPPKRARKDRFTLYIEEVSSRMLKQDKPFMHNLRLQSYGRAVISELMKYENVGKVDAFILEKRAENDFFAFNPLTLAEISSMEAQSDNTYLTMAHVSLVFVLTFRKLGSKLYSYARHCLSLLETLSLNFGARDSFVRMTVENKKSMVAAIEAISKEEGADAFMHEVDHRKLKLVKYLDIVRQPLCLNNVRSKLECGMYLNYNVALFELERIFVNCLMFNQRNSGIYLAAQRLLGRSREILLAQPGPKNTDFITLISYRSYRRPMEEKALNSIFEEILREMESAKVSERFLSKSDSYPRSDKIRRRMYLHKMREKASSCMYLSLGHFISDFNVIVDNCLVAGSAEDTRKCYATLDEFRRLVSLYFGEDTARIGFSQHIQGHKG